MFLSAIPQVLASIIIAAALIPVPVKPALSNKESQSASADDLLHILESNKFIIIRQVSDIPLGPLVAVRAIPKSRRIESIIVSLGKEYQDGHAAIDFSKPTAELVFGAMSQNYLLLCYRAGGLTMAEHILVIHCMETGAHLVAKGALHPEAKTLIELRQRLRAGNYTPFDLRDTEMVSGLSIP